MTTVYLAQTDFKILYETIDSIFTALSINEKVQGKRILIKPNLVTPKDPKTGLVTDPKTIEAIIAWLFKKAKISPVNIIIAEGGMKGVTDKAFEVSGMLELAERLNITTINLNKDKLEELDVPTPLSLKRVSIAKTLTEMNYIISVPSLKIHSMATTTLSLKNMMGGILPKGIMHNELDKRIADLNSVISPDLTVIDGIIGSEIDEVHGEPVNMNTIIVSEDPVAADTVGSAIMGINPKYLDYLQFAKQKGLGECNLDNINVKGNKIEELKKKFKI